MKAPTGIGALVLGLLCSQASAAPAPANDSSSVQPSCKEVAFSTSASAVNLVLDPVLPLLNESAALTSLIKSGNFTKQQVNGQETIAGWYCEPTVVNNNNNKLQFFQTSITTNRDSFLAQGGSTIGVPGQAPYPAYMPEKYSWVRYAAGQGYPTLVLDHLGNGHSSKPDPILLAQLPYELSLLHDLVTQIKAGTTGQLPRSYQHLIFVGNSYGSVIGNNFAAVYPDDFEQMVLTGFSMSVLPSFVGVSLQLPLPAALVNPARFGTLSLGYLAATIEAARTGSFFGSPEQAAFDPENAELFFQREDVVSIGQLITTYLLIVSAPAYKGRVLTLTGEHDQAFCGPGNPILGEAHCGPLLKNTGSLFPNADYNYQSIPQSGHALILHLSYAETLAVAHDFLAGAHYGS